MCQLLYFWHVFILITILITIVMPWAIVSELRLLFSLISFVPFPTQARSYPSTSHDQWVSLMAWSWGRENLSQSDSKRLYLPVKVKSCNPLIHRNMLILRRKVSQDSLHSASSANLPKETTQTYNFCCTYKKWKNSDQFSENEHRDFLSDPGVPGPIYGFASL